MEDVAALRAEIERLRDLLDENGIDPDVADRAPTLMDLAPDEFAKSAVDLWAGTNNFMKYINAMFDQNDGCFANTDVTIGETLTIRMPTDFWINRAAAGLDEPDYLAIARDLNNT